MKTFAEQKVSVQDMAACREKRAGRQVELLKKYKGALISLTLNIPGEIKQSALIYKAFKLAERKISDRLKYLNMPVLFSQEISNFTGNELFICVQDEPVKIKKALCVLEEADDFGRLLDIDVLRNDGSKVSRKEINLPERQCILCPLPVSFCAPQRKHSLDALVNKTQDIMHNAVCDDVINTVSLSAQKALLLESITSPKPGLVDRNNSGAHKDMDLDTFCLSANALLPYFRSCAKEGMQKQDISSLMPRLRSLGLLAEQSMYKATSGVNTHKGAIYGLGILCAAAGHALFNEESISRDNLFSLAKEIAKDEVQNIKKLHGEAALTGGVEQYKHLGLSGARGEAAEGFPTVKNIALPAFYSCLEKSWSFNKAGVYTLIVLFSNVFDSNVIRRKGFKRQQELKAQAKKLLEGDFTKEAVLAFDKQLIEENISPGGCADLLSFTYFVYMLENEIH